MLSWRILQITVYYKELLTINCQGTNHPRSILSFMDISRRSLVTHSAHWGRLCSVVCLSVLPFPFLTLVTLSLLFVPPSARSNPQIRSTSRPSITHPPFLTSSPPHVGSEERRMSDERREWKEVTEVGGRRRREDPTVEPEIRLRMK